MEFLPYDIQINILSYLNIDNIMTMSQTNKHYRKLCKCPDFWKFKSKRDSIISGNVNNIKRYVDYIDHIINNRVGSWDDTCRILSSSGQFYIVRRLINRGGYNSLRTILFSLCENNHLTMIKWIYTKHINNILSQPMSKYWVDHLLSISIIKNNYPMCEFLLQLDNKDEFAVITTLVEETKRGYLMAYELLIKYYGLFNSYDINILSSIIHSMFTHMSYGDIKNNHSLLINMIFDHHNVSSLLDKKDCHGKLPSDYIKDLFYTNEYVDDAEEQLNISLQFYDQIIALLNHMNKYGYNKEETILMIRLKGIL